MRYLSNRHPLCSMERSFAAILPGPPRSRRTGSARHVRRLDRLVHIHLHPRLACRRRQVVFWGGFYEPYRHIYAADASTGEIIWSYDPNPGPLGLQSTPAITDGVMYFASTDYNLYAFGTGLKWTYRDDLYADLGSNSLIVDSWSGGVIAASDTIEFVVTQTGVAVDPMPGSSDPMLTISPNPFTTVTAVSFEIAEPGCSTVSVFDLSGRLVRTLQHGELQAGEHLLSWDGTDDSGRRLPSGIYALLLSSPVGDVARRVCLVR